METEQIKNIKRLLRLAEIAQAKIEFNWNGTKVINPMQQGAANRIYTKAYKLKGEMSCQEFIKLHTEVINELKIKGE
jgi:hypothetical protein